MTQKIDRKETAGSPFHSGEIAMQEKMDVRGVESFGRRVIRPMMPDQHREFFQAQPFMVAAARDADGRAWATILEGDVGFVTSPTDTSLHIASQTVPGDALEGALTEGADIGLIGIELATRRRNRVNGRVKSYDADGLQFAVDQSFGNCPQHISARNYTILDKATPQPVIRRTELSAAQQDWIKGADTFFIASGFRGEGEHEAFGMDVSHRGGVPGFVEIVSDTQLRFPDYPGNNYYNTLGNILHDARIGMLFLDFASGSMLQLSGKATLDERESELAKFPGALRLLALEIEQVVELPNALRLRWDAEGESIREVFVVDKRQESADSTTFVLEARDSGALPKFRAGQYLPIEISLRGVPQPLRRTYSLTNVPGKDQYQITIKREPEGFVSRVLTDYLEVGGGISAYKPAGDFALPDADTPVLLISAGIGITPMVSLVQAALQENPDRKVWFLHGARDINHHPFVFGIEQLRQHFPALEIITSYSRPHEQNTAIEGAREGRLTPDLLPELEIGENVEAFICGPGSFAADWQDALINSGIAPSKVQVESFG